MNKINSRLNFKELGQRIKEIRGGCTQAQFAEKFGWKQANISRMERGEMQYCDLDIIYRICKANGGNISVEWLFTGEGEKNTPDQQDKTKIPSVDGRLRNVVNLLEQLLNAGNFRGLVKVEELLSSLLNKEQN
jgi:transcriptional regulator with XRE-family HTH domain